MTDVSILVPSYGDHELLARSLPRLLDSSTSDSELVVLNNDASQAKEVRTVVRRLADPRARVHELPHAAGFARAINAGIETTAGDVLFFANSDLFVSANYVDEMLRALRRRPRAGAATGKILRYDVGADRETDVIDTTGHVIGRDRRTVDRGENERDIGQYGREEQVFSVSGAALVARRAALESISVGDEVLDEDFGMYKEDVDLCWRLRLAGWECWYVPTAVAFHARTTHGLGSAAYLSKPRAFHAQQRVKPRATRINSMKNQWLLLVKNDDLPNVTRDLHRIVGREALVVGHSVVFSPRDTARAAVDFVRALPGARAKRRALRLRRTASPSQIRKWLVT